VPVQGSVLPSPRALAERDARLAAAAMQDAIAAFLGDPIPGHSALDQRLRQAPEPARSISAVPRSNSEARATGTSQASALRSRMYVPVRVRGQKRVVVRPVRDDLGDILARLRVAPIPDAVQGKDAAARRRNHMILALKAERFSASEIASALKITSRNAVIGVLYRHPAPEEQPAPSPNRAPAHDLERRVLRLHAKRWPADRIAREVGAELPVVLLVLWGKRHA
jgi:hypothetical protein